MNNHIGLEYTNPYIARQKYGSEREEYVGCSSYAEMLDEKYNPISDWKYDQVSIINKQFKQYHGITFDFHYEYNDKPMECLLCERDDVTIYKHGMCRDCYYDLDLRREAGLYWHEQYDYCQDCGRDDFPHNALGLCRRCYSRMKYLRSKNS